MSKKRAPTSSPHPVEQLSSPPRNQDGNNTNVPVNNANSQNIFDQTYTSEPPPYSSIAAVDAPTTAASAPLSSSAPASRAATSSFPQLDFSRYTIPEATISRDGSTVATYHPAFTSNPSALVRFVQEQAGLPPLPYIHIVGEGNGIREFDIKINMLPLFLGSNQNTQWNYMKLVAETDVAYRGKNDLSLFPAVNGGLEEWAKRFCKENSSLKTFTLNRQLSNWNASYIEGQIRSLIASTGYKHTVTVTFPVKYAKVVVYPPRSSENFFTNLFSPLLEKKRYEVVRAVWPYASLPPAANAAAAGRTCAVQTEEAWWEEWRDVLRWAVVKKRKGWVSVDDVIEYRMSPVPPEIPRNPWGM